MRYLIFLLYHPIFAQVTTYRPPSGGGSNSNRGNPVASLNNLQQLIDFAEQFMVNLLFLSGIALILGSLTQYIEHRKNPMNPPLSKVVTLLVLGLCLLGASFIPFPDIT